MNNNEEKNFDVNSNPNFNPPTGLEDLIKSENQNKPIFNPDIKEEVSTYSQGPVYNDAPTLNQGPVFNDVPMMQQQGPVYNDTPMMDQGWTKTSNNYYESTPLSGLGTFTNLPKEKQRRIFGICVVAALVLIVVFHFTPFVVSYFTDVKRDYKYQSKEKYFVFYRDGICSYNGVPARKCRYEKTDYGLLVVEATSYFSSFGERYYFTVSDSGLTLRGAYNVAGGVEQSDIDVRYHNFKLTKERESNKNKPIEIQLKESVSSEDIKDV